ncbi:hypothetical protein GQ457_07G004760 [Hibiscus cannabinus]
MGKHRGDASFLFLLVVVVSLHPFISVASARHLRGIYCPEIGYGHRLPPCKLRPIPRSPPPPEHIYSPPPSTELPPPPPTPQLSPPPPSIPSVPPPPRYRLPPVCPPREPGCECRRHRVGCEPCGVNDDGYPYCPPKDIID